RALRDLRSLPPRRSSDPARLRASARAAERFYTDQGIDVVLSPVLAHTTPRLGHLSPAEDYATIISRLTDWVSFTPLQNATGEPALSLPFGHDAEGLPVGIQLAGPRGADRPLLELAYAVEEARPFRRITELDARRGGRPDLDFRIAGGVCILLGCCPFSSVGRASPW